MILQRVGRAAVLAAVLGICDPALARDTAGEGVSHGWQLLQKGDATRAAALFRSLTQDPVRGHEATLGLAYALERLGQTEESLVQFERLQAAGYRPEEVKTAQIRLRATQAWKSYEAKDYAAAERQFRWLHDQGPQDAKVEEGLTLSLKAQKSTPHPDESDFAVQQQFVSGVAVQLSGRTGGNLWSGSLPHRHQRAGAVARTGRDGAGDNAGGVFAAAG